MKKFFFIVLVCANLFQSTTIYSKTNKEKAYSALGIGIIIVAAASYFYNRRSSAPIIQPAPKATDSQDQVLASNDPAAIEEDTNKKENPEFIKTDNTTDASKDSVLNSVKNSLLSSLDAISFIDANEI